MLYLPVTTMPLQIIVLFLGQHDYFSWYAEPRFTFGCVPEWFWRCRTLFMFYILTKKIGCVPYFFQLIVSEERGARMFKFSRKSTCARMGHHWARRSAGWFFCGFHDESFAHGNIVQKLTGFRAFEIRIKRITGLIFSIFSGWEIRI